MKTNNGSSNRRGHVKTYGLVTEGVVKKGGINSTAPSPKPAPPPGQPVNQSKPASSSSSNQSGKS